MVYVDGHGLEDEGLAIGCGHSLNLSLETGEGERLARTNQRCRSFSAW